MSKPQIPLGYLQNDKARKSALSKRKAGLTKKVRDLSTLCGVNACAIVYGPNKPQPHMWSSGDGAEHVINEFADVPEFLKSKYTKDQEGVANDELSKTNRVLKKLQKENGAKELSLILNDYRYNYGEWIINQSTDHLASMNDLVLKPKMEELEKRIAMFMQAPSSSLRHS